MTACFFHAGLPECPLRTETVNLAKQSLSVNEHFIASYTKAESNSFVDESLAFQLEVPSTLDCVIRRLHSTSWDLSSVGLLQHRRFRTRACLDLQLINYAPKARA